MLRSERGTVRAFEYILGCACLGLGVTFHFWRKFMRINTSVSVTSFLAGSLVKDDRRLLHAEAMRCGEERLDYWVSSPRLVDLCMTYSAGGMVLTFALGKTRYWELRE